MSSSERIIYGPEGDALFDPSDVRESAQREVGALQDQLVEAVNDRRMAERRAEDYAYELLTQYGDQQTRADLRPRDRRRLAKQAREIWAIDPQGGASVDLMNDFVFGRGVPRPRANDEMVQEILDEAWNDEDNQLVLTSYEAQVMRGTDLSLQSNVYFLMFADGDDGKVKLGLLNHDTVEDAVRDPEMRQRVLYYMARTVREEWDYAHDRPKVAASSASKIIYYEHWHNVTYAEDQGVTTPKPPAQRIGEGKVYHVAVNRTGEMVFGVPTMRRLIKWFTALNEYMAGRVDLTKAAAALIMKRKVKGGPAQVERMAAKELTRSGGELSGLSEMERRAPGSIITENESVSHEPLTIPTNAGNAMQDAQMIRSQISAATRWPQSYLGDASSANLATATSLELPVLKGVESRQEVWEQVFRWFNDRVIERAVETGRISNALTPDEFQEAVAERTAASLLESHPEGIDGLADDERKALVEAHEDKARDEVDTQRDLSYEFKMPHPLKRLMPELISTVTNIAKTFDPNGTNIELSRFLLGVALAEGLEVEDAQTKVDQIMPADYVDPAMAAFQAAQQNPPEDKGGESFTGAEGEQHTEDNAYGAPKKSQTPEQVGESSWREMRTSLGREGTPITLMREARYQDLGDAAKTHGELRKRRATRTFEEDVMEVARQAVARHDDARARVGEK